LHNKPFYNTAVITNIGCLHTETGHGVCAHVHTLSLNWGIRTKNVSLQVN